MGTLDVRIDCHYCRIMDNPISRINQDVLQINSEIRILEQRLVQMKQRLTALANAKAVLLDMGYADDESTLGGSVETCDVDVPPVIAQQNLARLPLTAASHRTSIKPLILQSLSYGKLWFTAQEVQGRTSEILGRDVPMSTISPYLSDLKKNGLVVREGMNVALSSRVGIGKREFSDGDGEA